MSTRRYSRKAVILLKKETTEGEDITPTAGANALKVRNLTISPIEGAEVSLDYIRGYFGASETLRVESYATCEFEVDFSGAAAPGTTPPIWSDAMLGCGFALTQIAAAVTGTAQAGSTSSITLAAGASATTNYYNGMTITATGGTGSGSNAVIIAYNGSTKVATLHKTFGSAFDATTTYSIAAGAFYEPITDSQSTVSIHYYLDGVRHILLGARGTVSFDLSAGAIPTMKFMFTGVDGTISDQANPTPTLTAAVAPSPLLTANVTGLLSGKEMIGVRDDHQGSPFPLIGGGSQKGFQGGQGAEFIPVSGHDESHPRYLGQNTEVHKGHGRSDENDVIRGKPPVHGLGRHPGPKGISRHHMRSRGAGLKKLEGLSQVVDFSPSFAIAAGALSHSPKIDAQCGPLPRLEGLRRRPYHVIVHTAAVQGMGMQDDRPPGLRPRTQTPLQSKLAFRNHNFFFHTPLALCYLER